MSIKLDLVREEKFCFHFSHVLGNVVDYANANPSAHVCFGDAQSVCAITMEGILIVPFTLLSCCRLAVLPSFLTVYLSHSIATNLFYNDVVMGYCSETN